MVHPDDINGLAKSMDRVLKDSKFREALIEKGLKRAALFSWENAARKTLAVYEEVIKKRQGLLY
jgi:glycosyltransferase involved in cell wall biosynthesis